MIIGYDKVGYMKFYLSSMDNIDITPNLTIKNVDKFFIVFNLNRYYVDWIDISNIKHYGNLLSFNRISKYIDYFKKFDVNIMKKKRLEANGGLGVKNNYINFVYSVSGGLMSRHYLHFVNLMSLSECLYTCFNKETIYSDFRLMKKKYEHNKELLDLLDKLRSIVDLCFSFIFTRIKVNMIHNLEHLENKQCGLSCHFDRSISLFLNTMNLVVDFYISVNIHNPPISSILSKSDEEFNIYLSIDVKFLFDNKGGYLCLYVKDKDFYKCLKIKDKHILDLASNIFNSKYVMKNHKKFTLL